jgi:predicted nucleic acid-binding protein
MPKTSGPCCGDGGSDGSRQQAALAATLYESVRRPQGREIDLAIAAVALTDGAALWTLNRHDFSDIPDLRLI